MHENDKPNVDHNLLEEMGYEPRDVNTASFPKNTAIFAVWFAATCVIAWLFTAFIAPDMVKPRTEDVLARRAMPQAPAPLLQSDRAAAQDMKDLRAQEQEKATTYGWTDRKTGHVRVPLSVAMEEVVKEGLPSRPGARYPEGEE